MSRITNSIRYEPIKRIIEQIWQSEEVDPRRQKVKPQEDHELDEELDESEDEASDLSKKEALPLSQQLQILFHQ